MKRNKAQISAQVFIYILAAVVVGLVLIVGGKAIITLINTGNTINIDSFQNAFKEKVLTYARQYESQTKIDEKLPPNGFDEICFADSRDEKNEFSGNLKNNPSLDNYVLIKESIRADAEPNVFLLNKKKITASFYVEKLDVVEDFLCISSKESIEVWLRGTGKVAELYTNENN